MPTYKIVSFQYIAANPMIIATISQTIDGKTWVLNRSISGAQAASIWNARGGTEDEIITLLLA